VIRSRRAVLHRRQYVYFSVPPAGEWASTGRLSAYHSRAHGRSEPRDRWNDILIVVLAARLGGTVVTLNRRHLEHWTASAAGCHLDVTVTPATRILA
jgi:predicted nucleic acid-binding protein